MKEYEKKNRDYVDYIESLKEEYGQAILDLEDKKRKEIEKVKI